MRVERRPGAVLCAMTAGGMDAQARSLGTSTPGSLADDTSHYLGWEHRHPCYERLLRYSFAPRLAGDIRLLFSHGAGTATYAQAGEGARETVAIHVRTGALRWRKMGFPARPGFSARVGAAPVPVDLAVEVDSVVIRPRTSPAVLGAGQRLEILFGG